MALSPSTVDGAARPGPPVPPTGTVRLAVGVVALEFAAAVQTFVAATLLPAIAADLHASVQLGLLLAGSTIGMFLALPLAPRLLPRLGYRRGLAIALPLSPGGLALASAAVAPWMFALGRLTGGLAGGLLAVFGLSAVIERLDQALRVRVIAAQSAMWIVPALVGPPVTLALQHLVGWRWALLLPVPFVLSGRLLLARGAVPARAAAAPAAPIGRALLVPAGITVLVAGSSVWHAWPLVPAGLGLAGYGIGAMLPAGTFRLRRGTPAALAAMLLFGLGYFGADGLIPVLFTAGYGQPVSRAAVALSVAPLAWGITSGLLPRLRRRAGRLPPAQAGLAVAAGGAAVLAALLAAPSWAPAGIVAWALAGVGVGLAYPGLNILSTTPTPGGPPAPVLAAAVLTAEAFGALAGQATGGGIVSTALAAGAGDRTGFAVAYGLFAACLTAAGYAASRAGE